MYEGAILEEKFVPLYNAEVRRRLFDGGGRHVVAGFIPTVAILFLDKAQTPSSIIAKIAMTWKLHRKNVRFIKNKFGKFDY